MITQRMIDRVLMERYWKTKEGTLLIPSDMSDEHLLNAIRLYLTRVDTSSTIEEKYHRKVVVFGMTTYDIEHLEGVYALDEFDDDEIMRFDEYKCYVAYSSSWFVDAMRECYHREIKGICSGHREGYTVITKYMIPVNHFWCKTVISILYPNKTFSNRERIITG